MLDKLINRFLPGDSVARTGILWNMCSFAVIGASGILLNALIGYFYTSSVLGAFNQSMAFYLVMGQLGALGLQNAATYFVARSSCAKQTASLFFSFLCVVLVCGAFSSLLLYSAAAPLGNYVFHSPAIAASLRLVAPAVLLFSINKLFVGFLNGLRYMRAYAVFQGMRYILIILSILCILLSGMDEKWIVGSLLLAETVILISVCIYLFPRLGFARPQLAYIKEGIRFGAKGVLGGIIGELNTKADILVLGMFCTDAVVGVYSFASTLAEGFFSLIVVLRNNMNPLFARMLHEKNKEDFMKLCAQVRRRTLLLCLLGEAALLVFFSLLCLFMPNKEYWQALLPLLIVLSCMTAASVSIVRGNILTQAGKPGLDTLVTGMTVLANLGINFLLIPHFGMVGAAIATGCSYFVFMFLVEKMIRKHVMRRQLGEE